MNTKKTYMLVGAIALVIFNVLFFLFKPSDLHTGAWISFVCINISLIILTLFPIVEGDYSRAIMKYSTVTLALLLSVVTLIAGIAIIAINPDSTKWAVAAHVVIFGVFAAFMLTNTTANEVTENAVREIEIGRDYTRGIARDIQSLNSYTDNANVKKSIEKLYDVVHSSPVKTNSVAISIENEIGNALQDLRTKLASISEEDAIAELNLLINMANDRNNMARR